MGEGEGVVEAIRHELVRGRRLSRQHPRQQKKDRQQTLSSHYDSDPMMRA